ncbi:hypothetical protein [Streptomyces sp. NPDC051183]|uniref:hypothetical protein n=1 Tax=Streptomyces sp. NPDC051183 TaxID=3155165 RepID=UPI00341EB774
MTFVEGDVVVDALSRVGRVDAVNDEVLTLVGPPGDTSWTTEARLCHYASEDEEKVIIGDRPVRVIGNHEPPVRRR